MDINLDNIARELYGTIQARFTTVDIGDENGVVLSKEEDIPKARFFEFPYKDNGIILGTIAITLDQVKGLVVQVGGEIVTKKHPGAYDFVKLLGKFAKPKLINFKVVNLEKSNLDKRDYQFQAKRKEEPVEPMMESKLYGTAKISYQDLGEARIVIKHSQPVNLELAAGRTMHVESIYIENADGERFKYPYKHLNGARALAEHINHGGNPYDQIGKHITGLSEELAQLRKFKGYVGRNAALAEAMGDISGKVFERIEQIKKDVHCLQRTSYYESFAEAFEAKAEQMIPETVMSDWIDRLTVRTFNEDLKAAFPYIFKLVDESEIPVKELNPEDMLSELSNDTLKSYTKKAAADMNDKAYSAGHAAAKGNSSRASNNDAKAYKRQGGIEKAVDRMTKEETISELSTDTMKSYIGKAKQEKDYNQAVYKMRSPSIAADKVHSEYDPARKAKIDKRTTGIGQAHSKIIDKNNKAAMTREEAQLESFLNRLAEDQEDQDGENTLFSPDTAVQQAAVEKLNQILATELPGGPNGVNAIESLKGLIDDPEFSHMLSDVNPELDTRGLIQQFILHHEHGPDIAGQLKFGTSELGGVPAETPPAALAPAPAVPADVAAAAAGVPPAPGLPPAPGAAVAPPPMPIAEAASARLKAKLIKAMECGADMNTKLDFGHRIMTLQDAMRECGMEPDMIELEPAEPSTESGQEQIEKSISGFWNAQEQNFVTGGTKAKQKVITGFKNGEYPNASVDDVKTVVDKIEQMDPSSDETNHITRMAGLGDQQSSMDSVVDNMRAKHHSETEPAQQINAAEMIKALMHKLNFGN